MKTLLICPSERPGVPLLSSNVPLALVSICGQTLLEYWLSHLACTGIKQVRLLVNDRPEVVRALVETGARWGLALELIAESRELTPAEALLKYPRDGSLVAGQNGTNGICVLDHFPGFDSVNLFGSYAEWFAGIQAWMPHATTPDRVGVRQLQPGVWSSVNARVSPTAQIEPPCWLGKNVLVGPAARVGPHAIIEDGSIIEAGAEIASTYIGPDTLVGQCSELRQAMAWGSTLINWRTGSATEVPDAFVLCSLRRSPLAKAPGWLERMAELWSPDKEEEEILNFLLNKQGEP
jgi:NDP-sugar pyrophosphorylase family protein